MDRETLIKKWLDHNLTEAESEAFKALPDYEELMNLNEGLQGFRAPDFKSDEVWKGIREATKRRKGKLIWLKTAISIAATLVVGFGLLFLTDLFDKSIVTNYGESLGITLPDASEVELNANSSIHFARVNWGGDRLVHLKGEAYFKVRTGTTFTVKTEAGEVRVLGTEFNVVHREGILEVFCFEGSVSVNAAGSETVLKPGEGFRILNGISNELTTALKNPSWLNDESSFDQWPLYLILNELERQYGITIDRSLIETNQSFTGSFTHNNLELALKSVLTPFNLSYTKDDNQIVLVSE